MAFTHSKDTRLFLNSLHMSYAVAGFTCAAERNLSTVTSIVDTGYKSIPGQMEGTLQIEGTFDDHDHIADPTTVTAHDAIRDTINVDNGALSTAVLGLTVGFPAFICRGDTDAYEVESSVKDAVKFTAQAVGDDGVDWGIVLHAGNAVTATGQDSNVDNTSSTLTGGVAALHVTAASGTTPNLVAKVQHSVDNSVWVDLITFTAATGKTSEYKTVTGTVNRHLRAQYTISGTTPSFTFLLSFARR